jgi:hypothetical protein
MIPGDPSLPQESILALPSHVLFAAGIEMGMAFESARRKYGQPVYLVPFRGEGKRRFVGRLGFTKERPLFFLHIKGFGLAGLLGQGAPQYAPDSVFLVLAHLCQQYKSDPLFLDSISSIAQDCAHAFQSRRVTAMNQEILAMSSVSGQFPFRG